MKQNQKPLPYHESKEWTAALSRLPESQGAEIDHGLEDLKSSVSEEIQKSIRVWDKVESQLCFVKIGGVVTPVLICFSVGDGGEVEFISWEMSLPKAA